LEQSTTMTTNVAEILLI